MANDKAPKQIEFFVSKSEQQLGPWTIQEVAAQLAAGHIAVTDFVYDDDRAEWIALFESEPLKAHLNAAKPKAAPAPKAAVKVEKTEPASTEAALAKAFTARRDQTIVETATVKAPTNEAAAEWFVQKGPNRYGPFTYLGVVRALQEKTVYEFDLVWKEGMAEWVRIAQHEAFTPDCIRGLATDAASSEGVFQKRQHARIPFESEVIVHDNRSVWLGRAFEGSVGGSGLIIENATLVPGQTVLLHFAAREDLPAFNALCEIVGKKYTEDVRDAKSPVQYSVRFVKLDSKAEPRVQQFFGQQKTAASA